VIWSGSPAQGVIVETVSTGGSGTSVMSHLALPLDMLAQQHSDRLLPIECPATRRADTRMTAEVLGGAMITRDSQLSTEFAMAVAHDWGAGSVRSVYRRFSRSGIADRVRRLFLGYGLTGGLAFETGATLGRDQTAFSELLATEREDHGVPIESLGAAGASLTSDSTLRIEGLTTQQAVWRVLIETLGAIEASITADSTVQVEGLTARQLDWRLVVEALSAVAASITADSTLRVESLTAQHADWGGLIEALGEQRSDTGAAIETQTNLRVGSRVSTEALVKLSRDVTALAELLAAGATTIVDATLTIEFGGAGVGALFSLESGPDRIRLLITPGRIRLLRRI